MTTTFDFKKFLAGRPLSWSAISSFEWNPDEWYERYILAKREPPTPELEFGKQIGERLASDSEFLPQVPRYKQFEYELKVSLGDIPLIGFIDSFEPAHFAGGPALYEYKTGKKPWTQDRADEHGQITMYLLMLYLQHKLAPEKVQTHVMWLPTKQNGDFTIGFIDEEDVRIFETRRTMTECLMFGKRIKETVRAMELFANNRV